MQRGELWWAALRPPSGSGPGQRRPVLVVQSEAFNRSFIQTVIIAAVTTNLRLAEAPGNVRVSRRQTGLPQDSVVNVSQLLTVDRSFLDERIGRLPPAKQREVDRGLLLALGLAGTAEA
jgi:mRNA interferase MazF